MAPERQVALRLGDDLIVKVDDFAARMQQQHPGLTVTRSAAVRMLVLRGLEAEATSVSPPGPTEREPAATARRKEAGRRRPAG